MEVEPADPGTNELLEVAYRFGSAVMSLATSAEPRRRRLVDAGDLLAPVEGALSGLWPEPHVPIELVEQIHGLLRRLGAGAGREAGGGQGGGGGSVEAAVAALDDDEVASTCREITGLAFALHQTVGADPGPR